MLTILLVVAVVGGVVLARRSGLSPETEYERIPDDEDPSETGDSEEVGAS